MSKPSTIQTVSDFLISVSETSKKIRHDRSVVDNLFHERLVSGKIRKVINNPKYPYIYFSIYDDKAELNCAIRRLPMHKDIIIKGRNLKVLGSEIHIDRFGKLKFVANHIDIPSTDSTSKINSSEIPQQQTMPLPKKLNIGLIVDSYSEAETLSLLHEFDIKRKLYDVEWYGSESARSLINAIQTAQRSGHNLLVISRKNGTQVNSAFLDDDAVIQALSKTSIPIISIFDGEKKTHAEQVVLKALSNCSELRDYLETHVQSYEKKKKKEHMHSNLIWAVIVPVVITILFTLFG